jgi:hypothetical protein
LKFPRFGGHLNICGAGVHNGKKETNKTLTLNSRRAAAAILLRADKVIE